jgi:ABC-type hemin transport system ATPase subunit
MRIEGLRLSWFRGAGPEVVLETKGKSVACFGPNGAGKSTFVDALEYLAGDGKIDHLSHEYSGKSQINGVRNTHAPAASPATIEIAFARDATIKASISPKGAIKIEPSSDAARTALDSWRASQLILRQDEVARFIHATKGEKYSALLPLLGLGDLETVVDNVRKLGKEIAKQGRIAELAAQVESSVDEGVDEAWSTLARLGDRYGVPAPAPASSDAAAQVAGVDAADALAAAIQHRLAAVDDDSRRRQLLEQIRALDLGAKARGAQAAAASVASGFDQIVHGRMRAIEGAGVVLAKAKAGKNDAVDCPSCGRSIARKELAAHVAKELDALARVRDQWRAWESAAASLETGRLTLNEAASRLDPADGELKHAFADFAAAATEPASADGESLAPRAPDSAALAKLVECAARLDRAIANELASAPPTAGELVADAESVSRARAVLDRRSAASRLASVRSIGDALDSIEAALRAEMHTEADRLVGEISAEVQRLWSRLHPGEPIEDVRLYAPEADKALDVSLKYYGRDQPSPRLTLSEGHRNSLGLCIFLALVRLRAPAERPIVLDDIVSSLDREHRGRVIDLLATEFADRQVLLFTHDHEWFADLRASLSRKTWLFEKLLPWNGPEVGLRWSGSVGRLEEARQLLADGHPEAAANRARADMDEHLAIAAEKLELQIPYRRGEHNDHRTWNDFLTKLISVGKKGLEVESKAEIEASSGRLEALEKANGLLTTIGNRGSHRGAIPHGDAEALINACERALDALRCSACDEPIWAAKSAKRCQCRCGQLAWKIA